MFNDKKVDLNWVEYIIEKEKKINT